MDRKKKNNNNNQEAVASLVVAFSVARTPLRKWGAPGGLVAVEKRGGVLCAVGVAARGDCARAGGLAGGGSGRFSSCHPVRVSAVPRRFLC